MSPGRTPAGGRDRGAVLPIVALLLPVLVLMTAFAVDLGRQRATRRTMQADADVIALDLVRLADGRTEDQILGDPAYATYVQGSATRNGTTVDHLEIEWGTWDETAGFVGTLGSAVPNAVLVTATDTIDYFFQPGTGSATRSAVATQERKAGFSIGSFAAAVDSGASPLLGPLLGDALGLGALAYDGLAGVDLDWLTIGTELGLATPEQLFSSDVTALDVVTAAADVLRRDDPSAAQVALLDQVIASPAAGALDGLSVLDVVDVTAGSEAAALGSTVNVLDFVAGAAFVANGSAGLALPTVTLGPPGFEMAHGEVTLIQSPATAYGPVGTTARTAQASTLLTSNVATVGLGSMLASTVNGVLPGVCGLLLLGPLLCGLTSVPVSAEVVANVGVDLASALGRIADIRCGATQDLDIDVASDLLDVTIGVQVRIRVGSNDAGVIPLTLVNQRPPGGGTADFVIPPDAFDVFKPTSPGVGSLTGSTTLSGLGGLGALLTPALNTVLNGVVTNINAQLVEPLAALVGARVASADVAARAIDCRTAILVG